MFSLSVKDVKTLLTIETTQYDEYIEKMLPIVIDLTEKYCKRDFAIRNSNGTYFKEDESYMLNELGLMIIIAKIIQFYLNNSGVSYESISRVTQTFSSDLPKALYASMNTYRKGGMKFL